MKADFGPDPSRAKSGVVLIPKCVSTSERENTALFAALHSVKLAKLFDNVQAGPDWQVISIVPPPLAAQRWPRPLLRPRSSDSVLFSGQEEPFKMHFSNATAAGWQKFAHT